MKTFIFWLQSAIERTKRNLWENTVLINQIKSSALLSLHDITEDSERLSFRKIYMLVFDTYKKIVLSND